LNKIALYHNLTSGGSKRELFEFTRRFKENGYVIHLYGHNKEKKSILDLSGWIDEIHLIPLIFLNKISFTLPFFKSIINLFIDLINIRKIVSVSKLMAVEIDKNNYDFIFVHHNKDYVQSPFILKYLKTKTVYFCAEPFRKFYERALFNDRMIKNEKNALVNYYTTLTDIVDKPCKKFIENRIKAYDYENVFYSDLVLTNSYFSRENILSAYGLNAKVIHLGGDLKLSVSPNTVTEKENSVISIGAINALKGYEFIIESLGTINEKNRPIFTIVGNATNNMYLSKIQSLANELNVVLSIYENISDDKLSILIQSSRLFVYAPYLEPLGLTPLEAMFHGLPVVAVKEGGPRETIVDDVNGFLVNRDPVEFGNKVSEILNDSTLMGSLSYGARDSIKSYWNWDLAFQRLNSAIVSGT
jgi:glycosyltransferase involved in cell wall biosynthesis